MKNNTKVQERLEVDAWRCLVRQWPALVLCKKNMYLYVGWNEGKHYHFGQGAMVNSAAFHEREERKGNRP